MTESVTLEDIYKLFQRSQEEADRRFAEADHRAAEADRRAAEADRRGAEADRRGAEADRRLDNIYKLFENSRAEADRRFAEADRRAAEFRAEFKQSLAQSRAEFEQSLAQSRAEFEQSLAQSRAEFDRRMAEADRQTAEFRARFERSLVESRAEFERSLAESRAEFDQRFAKTEAIAAQANEAVNNLTSRWGKFVENLVAPAVVELFQARGIAVQEIHTGMKAKRKTVNMEIDIFAMDDTVGVAIEVKSRLTQAGINQFIKNLGRFKEAFPAYKSYDIYGAVAGIEIDRGADRYAYKQGLFLIKQSGETVTIDNDADFRPGVW